MTFFCILQYTYVSSFFNSLIVKAYKKDLTEDDLFDLNPRDASDRVVPQFAEPWEKELAKHRKIE